MKKLMLMLCAVVMGVASLSAQKGQSAAGLNFGYGSEFESFSIGAKYQYGITDALRAEAAFNYWLENDAKVSYWDVDVTVHYLFPVAEKFKLYPLVGVMYLKPEAKGLDIDGEFGINAGAGAEYSITENIAINLEAKYQKLFGDLKNADQAAVSVGVAYKF